MAISLWQDMRRDGGGMAMRVFERRATLAIIAAGVILATQLGACVPGSQHRASPSAGGEGVDIYYRSQAAADAALAAFEQDNPSCQLWTNWQKMCIKDNHNSTICFIDSARPVRPSTPFCVGAPYESRGGDTTGLHDTTELPASAREIFLSVTRFCRPGFGTDEFAGSLMPDGSFTPSGLCHFRSYRPFGSTRAAVGRGGHVDWRSADDNASHRAEPVSYAAFRRELPNWCAQVGNVRRVQAPVDGDILAISLFTPYAEPVLGAYCQRRISE